MLRILGISAIFLAVSIHGECPRLSDIPDMINDNTFTCARFYYGHGHDLGVRGCNGCSVSGSYDIPDGADYEAGDNMQYPMGSILVKPGCTLYVFHGHNYGGSADVYEGPTVRTHVSSGHDSDHRDCAKGINFSKLEPNYFGSLCLAGKIRAAPPARQVAIWSKKHFSRVTCKFSSFYFYRKSIF